jgi:hypothetical protein
MHRQSEPAGAYPEQPLAHAEGFRPLLRAGGARGAAMGTYSWRGGVRGWMGAGIRTAAGWFGDRLQSFGRRVGGELSEASAELGQTVRGRFEQMGSALEERRGTRMTSGNRGPRGPRGYRRPDERILDELCERIALSGAYAEEVEVQVRGGVVTLTGKVPSRTDRQLIEEVGETVFGVQEIQTQLAIPRAAEAARGEGPARMAMERVEAEPARRGNGHAVEGGQRE